MKRLQKLAVFLLALLLVTVPALAAAPTKADKKEAERQELRTKTYQALKLLYEKKPKSKRAMPTATLSLSIQATRPVSLAAVTEEAGLSITVMVRKSS